MIGIVFHSSLPLRTSSLLVEAGASIPSEAMMHFPLFQIPPIFEKSKNFQTLWKIFKILPFSRKISRFSSAKISDDLVFLVIDPLFSLFQYISPLFRENYNFPLL